MQNYDELFTDPHVFDNSGINLAEYLLSKKNTQIPTKLFNLRKNQEESEDVSLRFIEKKKKSLNAPPASSKGRPSVSSTSSSNNTFVGFAPGTTSTPFPTKQKPSQPRKTVSVPEKFLSVHTQTSKDSSTDQRSISENRKQSLNATNFTSRGGAEESRRVSQTKVGRPPSRIGNVPDAVPSLGIAPYAQEPMAEATQPKSPQNPPERRDSADKVGGNTFLRVRSFEELQDRHDSQDARERSKTLEKTQNKNAVPDTGDVESIVITDDESAEEQVQNVQESQKVLNQSRVCTIQDSQKMDISRTGGTSSEKTTTVPQKTITTAMSIAQDWGSNSSDEEPTLVPSERRQKTPEAALKPPVPQNDVTSGFVDSSSQASHTVFARPTDRAQNFRAANTSVIPEVTELHTRNNTFASQASCLTMQNGLSPAVDRSTSTVFKAPGIVAAKKKKKNRKKPDTPVRNIIELEKSLRSTIPRPVGSSCRKLYPKRHRNGEEDEEEVGASVVNTPSPQESEVFDHVEKIVQDDIVACQAPTDIPSCQVPIDIPSCHVYVERIEVLKDVKKKTKSRSKRKPLVELQPVEEELNDGLRRSRRQKHAPTPFWLGRQHTSQQLVVQTYNENVPLKKRYMKMDTLKESDVQLDVQGGRSRKKHKMAKKKLRKNSAGEAEEKAPEDDGVEPQLEEEPGPSRQQEQKSQKKKAKNSQENKKSGEKSAEARNDTPARSQDEVFDQLRAQMGSALEAAQVMDFGKNSCQYVEVNKLQGMQVFVSASNENCGYLQFQPGCVKRCCRLVGSNLCLVVLKGSFQINVNGQLRNLQKYGIIIIKKDMKYGLTYNSDNQEDGELFYLLH